MFGNAVDAVSVAIQRCHEGLGEYAIQLSGIQGSGVLPRHLKWVESRIIIPGNCREKRTDSAKHSHYSTLAHEAGENKFINDGREMFI